MLKTIFTQRLYEKGYLIHQKESRFILCKVLNEYDTETEAENDILELLANEITEDELTEKFC